jgi:fucose 4-O-acetylase-like acetyltransferase
VFFFGIVSLPFWVGEFLLTGSPSLYEIKWRTLGYVRGAPGLNWMTWFLVCLFTTELLAYGIMPRIERSLRYILVSLFFLLLGLFLCDSISAAEKLFGLQKNTWYVHEALVAFGFYSLGYLLFPYFKNLDELNPQTRVAFAALFLGLAAWTNQLNDAGDRFAVFLIGSSHGFKVPFLVTSILGSLGVVVVSSLIPSTSFFRVVGANTVILMGLNGLFHNFVNKRVASLYAPMDGHLVIFSYVLTVTLFSISVCLPVIYFLNRWVPQLVGKSGQRGPILPDLEAVDWKGLIGRFTGVDAKFNSRQGG